MRLLQLETGKIVVDKDEVLLAKIQSDPSLAGIDVSDFRINAESLMKLYNAAEAQKTPASIKRYALMRQLFLATFSK